MSAVGRQPIPDALADVLAGILADALVADFERRQALIAATAESPSGRDRGSAALDGESSLPEAA